MRVPIRKPGKHTHEKPDPHITQEKYNEMKQNLEKMLKQVRPRLSKEVKRLALMGDFSENAAYSIAKGKLRGLNQRILEVEDHLRRAIIIKKGGSSSSVKLGNTVVVEVDGVEKHYTILGSSEVDLEERIISHNSPLGKALMNRRVGDNYSAVIGTKKKNFNILKVE